MPNLAIGHNIIRFPELSSTNQYASQLTLHSDNHGTIVRSDFQTQGRGQRDAVWESEKGKNLLFSVVLFPNFLKVQRQFLLSKAVSLALCDVLKGLANDVYIKWPNDIYIGDEKVAGILIENSFSTAFLTSSIVGVGLNVNQTKFLSGAPNPTSLKLKTGQELELDSLLNSVCEALQVRYEQLESCADIISKEYLSSLYRADNYYNFRANDQVFSAKIIGISPLGHLMLQTSDGAIASYAYKEVEYIL